MLAFSAEELADACCETVRANEFQACYLPNGDQRGQEGGKAEMKYFTLEPADPTLDAWLFFEEDAGGRLQVRQEYRDLRCEACGKLDEDQALARGVSPSFRVKTKRDWAGTADDEICASARFRELVEAKSLEGLRFLPIPSSSEHFVVFCENRVETDLSLAGFEDHVPCPKCGRYRERLVGPSLAGLKVPDSPLALFASAVANESVKSAYRPIFGSETVVKILKAAKVKGLDCVPAW